MKPLPLAALLLLFGAAFARAESRTLLIQVKQGKDDKPAVTIHSDVQEDRRTAATADEAAKAVAVAKGWGSLVHVYIVVDRGASRAAVKPLLKAISDNAWLELVYLGPDVPRAVGDHFLEKGGER